MKNSLLFACLLATTLGFGQQNIVRIESGLIEGKTNALGTVQIFKGIPFAAPPVGNLRWKAPQPVQKWEGIKKCVEFGTSPMQPIPAATPFFGAPTEPFGEDCLYLNLWTATKSATEKRPVIVYIYGGGFTSGRSSHPLFDGEAMARKGVVFVCFNYRLGNFGFLAHPELSQEALYHSSGCYGILDMIAVLQWVQKNIAAFGGNPTNVTLAGQSAGAFAVNYLTCSPLAKGLFHRAIAESGGRFYETPTRKPFLTLKAAEEQGISFANTLTCSSLAELRAKSAEAIMKAKGGFAGPLLDSYLLTETMADVYAKGKQTDVPLLIGWNEDEIVQGGLFPPPIKAEVFRQQIRERFGELADDLLKCYPFQTDQEALQAQSAMFRDELYGIHIYTWAKMQVKTGHSKVYLYNFNRKLPAGTPETNYGAYHSGEFVYAYHNLHTMNRPWEAVDHRLSEVMSSYWVNFAKTGDPNAEGLPDWNAYNPATEKVMVVDTQMEAKQLPTQNKLLFWERYFTELNQRTKR